MPVGNAFRSSLRFGTTSARFHPPCAEVRQTVVQVSRHDIVIVGGGGAGLRAAIAAAESDPGASIALVSKVYPMRSHTVSAEGGAAAVAREDAGIFNADLGRRRGV